MEACLKEKAIAELKNFGEGWDFGRFVTLFEGLGKDGSLSKHEEILLAMKNCREGRNLGAHECYAKQVDRGYSDEELSLLARTSRTYIPLLNSDRRESAKIKKRLQDLEDLLSIDEDSDVLFRSFEMADRSLN